MTRVKTSLTIAALAGLLALPASALLGQDGHEGHGHGQPAAAPAARGQHGHGAGAHEGRADAQEPADKTPMHQQVHGQVGEALQAVQAAREALQAGNAQAAEQRLARAEALLRGVQQTIAEHHGTHRFANVRCPIMGSPINPENVTPALTRTWQGQTIAFCCAGCPERWDALTPEQKQARLEPVLRQPADTPGEPTSGIVNTRCPIMGGQIDPANVPADLTRTYNGQTVGFCCAHCPGAWDKLTDAQKQARLQQVTPARP